MDWEVENWPACAMVGPGSWQCSSLTCTPFLGGSMVSNQHTRGLACTAGPCSEFAWGTFAEHLFVPGQVQARWSRTPELGLGLPVFSHGGRAGRGCHKRPVPWPGVTQKSPSPVPFIPSSPHRGSELLYPHVPSQELAVSVSSSERGLSAPLQLSSPGRQAGRLAGISWLPAPVAEVTAGQLGRLTRACELGQAFPARPTLPPCSSSQTGLGNSKQLQRSGPG